MSSPNVPLLVFMFAGGLFIVRRFAWQSWLFIFPRSPLIEIENPDRTVALERAQMELLNSIEPIGFQFLGTLSESFKLGETRFIDVFAGAEGAAFLFSNEKGSLWALSMGQHQCVLSANFKWPNRPLANRYISGSMQGLSAPRLIQAHARRVENALARYEVSLEGAAVARRRWYQEFAVAEVRFQNATGLLWTLSGMTLVLAGAWGLVQVLLALG
jgi:hypothetical protein